MNPKNNSIRPARRFPGPAREDKISSRFNQLPAVRQVGKMIFDPIWAQKKHQSGTNELIHILRGRVVIIIGNARFEAGPGETLIVPEGSWHRDDFDLTVGLEVFMIFFAWPPFRDYFRVVPLKSVQRLCLRTGGEIGRLCDRMQVGLNRGAPADHLVINSSTHMILLLILREALSSGHNTDEHRHHARVLLLQARQYIDEHYVEHVSLDQMAQALRISPFYLSHIFSRESEISFVEYITSVRMRKAKELLLDGARNVAEVAYAVGYNDSNYFSRVFHRYFGVNPARARCGAGGYPARKRTK